ncbi:MAG TPA: hypothetical protein VHC86_11120 [Opitutaceae bacterium]|nr:hypothetical protein [Opitutaceae bacterium]
MAKKKTPEQVAETAEDHDSLTRDPSDPPSNRGQQVPDYNEPDGEDVVEREVLQGVERAQIEQERASGLDEDEPDDEAGPDQA